MRDFIMDPSQYKALKSNVIYELRDSEKKRLRALLNQAEFGDQRPSRFLRRLKELAKGKMSDELLKWLWIQHLPTNMQGVLATCSDDLDKLAVTADKIHDRALACLVLRLHQQPLLHHR